MILGDNSGAPERRRVVFDLLKEGRPLTVGGKYSEVMFVWAVAETRSLSVRWRWKGVLGTAGRGGRGYIPPGGG